MALSRSLGTLAEPNPGLSSFHATYQDSRPTAVGCACRLRGAAPANWSAGWRYAAHRRRHGSSWCFLCRHSTGCGHHRCRSCWGGRHPRIWPDAADRMHGRRSCPRRYPCLRGTRRERDAGYVRCSRHLRDGCWDGQWHVQSLPGDSFRAPSSGGFSQCRCEGYRLRSRSGLRPSAGGGSDCGNPPQVQRHERIPVSGRNRSSRCRSGWGDCSSGTSARVRPSSVTFMVVHVSSELKQ